jgi:hypothetical protein
VAKPSKFTCKRSDALRSTTTKNITSTTITDAVPARQRASSEEIARVVDLGTRKTPALLSPSHVVAVDFDFLIYV